MPPDVFLFKGIWIYLIPILAAWSLAWKGIALWRASRNNSLGWFIALLVVNTLGILEMVYIFWLGRTRKV